MSTTSGIPQAAARASADSPFFIVGCGRSGTSLLRGILNRHPEVAIPLESLFIVDYLRASPTRSLAGMQALLLGEPELREWGIAPGLAELSGCSTVADAIEALHRLYAAPRGKVRWGQKTPRFIRHLDLIQGHFPGARFVHIVRDPRAVARSLIQSDVHRSNAYYAARRWSMDVRQGLAFEEHNPAAVHRLSYESFVRQPELELQRLLHFLGLRDLDAVELARLPADDEYSTFYRNIHANLLQAPTPEFIDRWRVDLNATQIETVEAVARDLMLVLGYEPLRGGCAPVERPPFGARLDRGRGILRQLWRYLRYRPQYLPYVVRRKIHLGLWREFLWELNY